MYVTRISIQEERGQPGTGAWLGGAEQIKFSTQKSHVVFWEHVELNKEFDKQPICQNTISAQVYDPFYFLFLIF